MADAFDVPADPLPTVDQIPRDRYDRPKVVPPGGDKPTPYTRCTTFVDCLEDKYNLTQWEKRMVAVGLADPGNAHLLLAVVSHAEDKNQLNRICNEAKDSAKAGAKATTGTALHALTERYDRGLPLPALPESAQRDIDAYVRATRELEHVAIEQFVVNDELKVGGTPDRVSAYRGELYILDVKTGNVDFGAMKIAMQLAMYSRSTPYDFSVNARTPWPADVNQDWGIVAHLPAGKGYCELRWIDLRKGWDAVLVANSVREWRKERSWYRPYEAQPARDYLAEIEEANNVDALYALYSEAQVDGHATPELKARCAQRKKELQ
ncbi:PD-(D/E)XK nuclease family protein [Saccharopolyspora mangrovi]|uniref:PD-(D/E)XK nuclease family protein n=1 Tax=Saccharopolyspora mangrovi TaxID=3082379 RepID=A0ABU6A735_9PSEU|nr:PD-(D/E)XK nuclease family protein [Saccharopolyspora sp. S2-29]MEB3367372.1 PD-(D/E)XK nuclease family protein [Saccharopolyspora sp. S2-29]